MIRFLAFAAAASALLAQAANAAEVFEGKWAQTQKACRGVDGPSSRTLIDLSNREKGKSVPLFDQYEHHCRIDISHNAGAGSKLSLRCFEFWDDYRAGKNPVRQTVTLSPTSKNTLKIDGRRYIRCRD